MKCLTTHIKKILLCSFLPLLITNPPLQAHSEVQKHHRHHISKNRADYVVVGVGTAGAGLCKALTNDRKTSVIAVHNGLNLTQDPAIKFSRFAPVTVASALIGSPFYITGDTTPQPNADNREIFWALAIPLGGASSINAGAWCRGTDVVYSQWEAVAGPEWSLERITTTFKEIEHYHGETPNPAFRGFHGPVSVVQNPNPSKVSIKFTRAIIAGTGFPFVLDYNDPLTPIGASTQLQSTVRGPRGIFRVSSSTAFLKSSVMTPSGFGVNGRKLRVLFNSTALRTLWEGNKAVGVEYLNRGKVKKVYANKGVIVCAGIYSSAFLMHSGVGPQALLDTLDIPVVFDNPNVGQGLYDQPQVPTVFTANPNDYFFDKIGVFEQIA